ncbi:hypothetical protein [Kitasatospora acidiphila]|uniref:hypothetical protein n=1 Tax=Kitasatospora acidiphila TaxID=2567942 RepID=UPI0015F08F11|nr:hypothetical protein [Kitasatospora acidiphila]
MHEEILTPFIGGDEAVPANLVEPQNVPCRRHNDLNRLWRTHTSKAAGAKSADAPPTVARPGACGQEIGACGARAAHAPPGGGGALLAAVTASG